MYTPIEWWVDYSVWLMLQYKFMMPAVLIEYNDNKEKLLGQFGLNGFKTFNLCKPY
jgi:hypothetical protein